METNSAQQRTAARLILHCPVSKGPGAESFTMEVTGYLEEQKKTNARLWGYYHSRPFPPVFFAPYSEMDQVAGGPLKGQGAVVFAIDCRTRDHARQLIDGLWKKLQDPEGAKIAISDLALSAAIYDVECHDLMLQERL